MLIWEIVVKSIHYTRCPLFLPFFSPLTVILGFGRKIKSLATHFQYIWQVGNVPSRGKVLKSNVKWNGKFAANGVDDGKSETAAGGAALICFGFVIEWSWHRRCRALWKVYSRSLQMSGISEVFSWSMNRYRILKILQTVIETYLFDAKVFDVNSLTML